LITIQREYGKDERKYLEETLLASVIYIVVWILLAIGILAFGFVAVVIVHDVVNELINK